MELLLIAPPLATLALCVSGWVTTAARARVAAPTRMASMSKSSSSSSAAAPTMPFLSFEPAPRAPRPEPAPGNYLPRERWDELLVTDGQGLPTLYLQMHTGELRLTEPTTGKLVRVGNDHLRRMGIWTVDLGGVGVHKTAVREGLLQPGSPMSLVREPQNEHDGDAIAVHAAAGRPVGYVNKRTAAGLSRLLDTGTRLDAISIAFDSSDATGRRGGVKVLAGSPELVRHLLRDRPAAVPMAPVLPAY